MFTTGGSEKRIRVAVGNDSIVAVFPPDGDPAFERAKKELLDSRFESTRRGKTKNVASTARVRFFDAQCRKIEGWQHEQPDGTLVDAMTLEDWRSRFPTELKVSIVATRFEEQETLDDEEREDLPPASVAD
jgi:hypothetical protein